MISFNSETNFSLVNDDDVAFWLRNCLLEEEKKEGEINYIFCDDNYLAEKNIKYLKHNTLTDIISFDYTMGRIIAGDVFISVERVLENAQEYGVGFDDELHRVMIHGILHFCGYKDKIKEEKQLMRSKEDYYLSLRTL